MASALIGVAPEEETLVAELELLGIRYLSRQTAYRAERVRAAEVLLADLMRQPAARVRVAVIPLLLAHPEFAQAVPLAVTQLTTSLQLTLKLFYTAAVSLQRIWSEPLRAHLAERWRWLPDFYLDELGLHGEYTPTERLHRLGREHQQRTAENLNWVGTYENAARKLLRQWEMERLWNQ
jgi:hypothetical protein